VAAGFAGPAVLFAASQGHCVAGDVCLGPFRCQPLVARHGLAFTEGVPPMAHPALGALVLVSRRVVQGEELGSGTGFVYQAAPQSIVDPFAAQAPDPDFLLTGRCEVAGLSGTHFLGVPILVDVCEIVSQGWLFPIAGLCQVCP